MWNRRDLPVNLPVLQITIKNNILGRELPEHTDEMMGYFVNYVKQCCKFVNKKHFFALKSR